MMLSRRRLLLSKLALLLLVLALSSACSTIETKRRDWSKYAGPGAQYFHAEEIPFPRVDDPLEPTNRALAGTDLALARYVIRPVAAIYRSAVPQDVREHLTKAADNLLYPGRLLNNLLQAKWSAAAEETGRFFVNTTVGVLGFFDPATDMGLHPRPEDFGQTFAKWGWKRSTYLFVPILGPSSIRDALGAIPDTYAEPATYYLPAALGRRFHLASNGVEAALRQVEVNYDAYEPARTLFTLNREVDVEDFSWARDESGVTQSLDAIFLEPEDRDFGARAHTDTVRIEATGRELPFSFWLQAEPAPLVFLVPGLGGHRLGASTLALAEIAFLNGSSVVAISNPTNWEFIENGASLSLPGYVPSDAHDVHIALTRVNRRLVSLHPGRFTSKRLTGISLGALHTLFIAGNERRAESEGLVPFDVYVALDPAVSLEHGLLALDRFYNAPLAFAPEERAREIDEIFGKVLYLSHGELDPGMELPFTKLEAEFLIGLAYRLDLQFLILASQERHDLGVLRTRRTLLTQAPAFREVSEYSYMEYMHAFVLPYLSTRVAGITCDEAGARRIFERCDLRAVEGGLRANPRVLVFANENDFLLRAEDITWLRDLLGARAHFFPAGGHLGNLHRKTIHEVIDAVVESTDERAPDHARDGAADPDSPSQPP